MPSACWWRGENRSLMVGLTRNTRYLCNTTMDFFFKKSEFWQAMGGFFFLFFLFFFLVGLA